MKNYFQTKCDACEEILEGQDGTAEVRKNYITVKGSICSHYYDQYKVQHHLYDKFRPANKIEEKTGRAPFLDYEYYNFCNGFCLDDFMGQRLIMKAKYHEANNLPKIDIYNI